MAKPARVYTQGNAVPSAAEQQRQIAEQTAAFLAGGGCIQQIPRGVSGQPKLGGPPVPAGAAVAD